MKDPMQILECTFVTTKGYKSEGKSEGKKKEKEKEAPKLAISHLCLELDRSDLLL